MSLPYINGKNTEKYIRILTTGDEAHESGEGELVLSRQQIQYSNKANQKEIDLFYKNNGVKKILRSYIGRIFNVNVNGENYGNR